MVFSKALNARTVPHRQGEIGRKRFPVLKCLHGPIQKGDLSLNCCCGNNLPTTPEIVKHTNASHVNSRGVIIHLRDNITRTMTRFVSDMRSVRIPAPNENCRVHCRRLRCWLNFLAIPCHIAKWMTPKSCSRLSHPRISPVRTPINVEFVQRHTPAVSHKQIRRHIPHRFPHDHCSCSIYINCTPNQSATWLHPR
jgi:hypothetical protein